MESVFEKINCPGDIKRLNLQQLQELAEFLRNRIISTVSKTGGHLASSLGTVELTIALHRVFDSPKDKIIWDVGHQCYAHKLLTGRMDKFCTIRQHKGLSGFTKSCESAHDPFGAGHSSTSISSALGYAAARDQLGEDYEVVAVIGDGAMTGGLAFEGLNNAGHEKADMIVILNDNEMSISKNVGAMARYLSRLRMRQGFIRTRHWARTFVRRIPKIGKSLLRFLEDVEDRLTYFLMPGVNFEAMGFKYLGPFDGHDMDMMCQVFRQARQVKGPKLIHIVTQKGRGYLPAEQDATHWHGATPFDVDTGNGIKHKETGLVDVPKYSDVFCNTLIRLAQKDPRIVAITAAMPDGTGLIPFMEKFPKRIYDVGIAEQHAITFAAGLAAGGMKPIAAIYSTFLQRAYDQIVHDVCLQKLPVIFALDRAGLVGEDGPTHHGVFDLSFLRSIPDIVIMSPKNENEMQHMLYSAFAYNMPVAIRYPRGRGIGIPMDDRFELIPAGKAEVMREGDDLAIMALGNMVYPSVLAAEKLANYGINASVINMRFVKPLDRKLIIEMAKKTKHIITVEENTIKGGFGSSVMEIIHEEGISDCRILTIGIPDHFVEHGNMNLLREKYGLTCDGIVNKIRESMQVMPMGVLD